jgi:hypothetical protein
MPGFAQSLEVVEEAEALFGEEELVIGAAAKIGKEKIPDGLDPVAHLVFRRKSPKRETISRTVYTVSPPLARFTRKRVEREAIRSKETRAIMAKGRSSCGRGLRCVRFLFGFSWFEPRGDGAFAWRSGLDRFWAWLQSSPHHLMDISSSIGVEIRDPQSLDLLRILLPHEAWVTYIFFSPDSARPLLR